MPKGLTRLPTSIAINFQAYFQQTADTLIKYGALIVRDSRVTEEDNEAFLNTLEDYFAQDTEQLKYGSYLPPDRRRSVE
jgi:hypothetical protein